MKALLIAVVAGTLPFLSGLDISTTPARFKAAKVVALVRLTEPPAIDPNNSRFGPLSKFYVVRSWKGPFPTGTTITAATAAVCGGAGCAPYPTQPGALVVIFSLGDVEPIWPILTDYSVDDARVEQANVNWTQWRQVRAPNLRWRGHAA